MNRIALAESVITIVETYGGFVFGGYLRDQIAGVVFDDVDVWIPGNPCGPFSLNATVVNICSQLSNTKGTLIEHRVSYMEDLSIDKYSIEYRDPISCDYINFNLSMVATNMLFRTNYDVDVNCLFRSRLFHEYVCLVPNFTADNIIKHIRNREYETNNNVSQSRIDKIEEKGYRRVGTSGIGTSEVCSECGGTGELDFGFYKRECDCKLK
jgi:hypothetical protein